MNSKKYKSCAGQDNLPCDRKKCIYSGQRAMCLTMDQAGVPDQGKWRSLILYYKSLAEQSHLEKEQQQNLKKLVIQAIQKKDFSDENYQKLIRDMLDIMNSPLQKKLQEALMETSAIAKEYGKFLNKNKDRVSDLGETTVRDIESGIAPEDMIENIRSSFRDVVSGMEEDIVALRAITETDGLTGLYNRRTLDAFLADVLKGEKADQSEMYIFLLDLDHFKNVNDSYGHLVGDHVLKTVADLLKQPEKENSKQGDQIYFPARYGGEEFALCLKGYTFEKAVEIGEELRKKVKKLELAAEDNNGELKRIPLTMSMGLAKNDTSAEEPISDILNRADAALYKAKHNGRDQLEIDQASW